jgi:ATP-binding cassette, subfamily B, heavy metal transporter
MENIDKKINYKKGLQEYWSFLKKYKTPFIVLLISITIIETLNLIPKFLFMQIIDNGVLFTSNEITKDYFIQVALIILAIFITISVVKVGIKWIKEIILISLESNLIYDVKERYFNHIISLDQDFHTSHKTGSMISRLGRGAGSIEGLTDVIVFNFTPLIVQIIIVGASLAYFSLIPAIIISITSIVFIAYSIFLQQYQKRDKKIYNNTQDIEKGNMADFFTNIESIKYFGKDKAIMNKYQELSNDTRKKQITFWEWHKLLDTGQTTILAIGTILIVYFPIISFMNGEITIGTVSLIYTAYVSLLGALYGFVWGVRGYYRSMTDLEDLLYYKKYKNSIKDKQSTHKANIQKGKIELKNVNFEYPKGEQKIFKDFNLTIPAGKKTALVGHSGCGKSTILKLLYRFYDIQSGEIEIDNNNIKDFKQDFLRSEMAIVSQEPILFDDTISNNIRFSNPKAKEHEVKKAIKSAQLDKVIEVLPQKEHTIVGERGVKLSGGQKQRVSIARAILADKKILILDEATSALDSETEFEIQKDLEKLMKNRTSIIIAHRLSTIMNADNIVVLKDGKIEQMGTHRELITEGGEYAKLWEFQKGGYI